MKHINGNEREKNKRTKNALIMAVVAACMALGFVGCAGNVDADIKDVGTDAADIGAADTGAADTDAAYGDDLETDAADSDIENAANAAEIQGELDFDKNVCGTYRGDEGPGWEVRFWDIANIDGRYYLDYIGEYDYAAAEIELLDEKPYLCGDELRYMVKVYPYSGFSFGGEYQGTGQVMYIASKVGIPGKRIVLSPGNPFFYGLQTMYETERAGVHEVQEKCEANITAPEIVGSWRSIVESESREYEVYLQFDGDGRVDIVRKSENYTPMIYRGIYNLNNSDGKFVGRIEAEAMGMGSQPLADWILEFAPASDSPIRIVGEFEDDNPLVYGASDMKFEKTEPGKHDINIHAGPYMREDEVSEMWDEYMYSDEDFFAYDFQPEFVEAIVDKAVEWAQGTSGRMYGIQDNKNGGEMWIQVLGDATQDGRETKNWVRFDFGESEYYDIFDNRLDEE